MALRQWRINVVSVSSCLASRLPMSRVGYKAPICSSSSKPPATLLLLQLRMLWLRHAGLHPYNWFKQIISVLNKSVNIAFDLERSPLSTTTKYSGTARNICFSSPCVKEMHMEQGCIGQLLNLGQFSSELDPHLSSTVNQFLLTNVPCWSYAFSSDVNRCATNLLCAIVCSVCRLLAKKTPNLHETVNKVLS